jgi:pimeloyl-ACP methyl ester carboxylesterase
MDVLTPIPIPLLGGSISGGEAITIDSFNDLAALRAMCAAVPDTSYLFEQIRVKELRSRFQDLRDDWVANQERYDLELLARVRNLEPDEMENIDQIQLVLGIAEAVWSQEEQGPDGTRPGLALVFAIAEVGGTLELEIEEPALIWSQGSILSRLTAPGSLAFTAGAWCIALARGHGAAASVIAQDLVESLRTERRNQYRLIDIELLDLERLDSDSITRASSLRYSAIVILIHGLLSTDLGTFDGFIKELRIKPLGTEVLFVGWPHDTLTSVSNSADQLADKLHNRIGPEGPDLVLVCHSRGGLVARATALKLYEIHPRYRTVLRGAITFGTPHQGASLAGVATDSVLGHFVSISATLGTRTIWRLSELLLYRKQQRDGVIQGIEDLRRPDAAGFISQLRQRELEDPKKPTGAVRQLRLCCVGGDYKGPVKAQTALAKRYFGKNTKHDLVVELESSLPEIAEHRIVVNCSHFDYCSELMRQSSGFQAAVQVARNWLAG